MPKTTKQTDRELTRIGYRYSHNGKKHSFYTHTELPPDHKLYTFTLSRGANGQQKNLTTYIAWREKELTKAGITIEK
tara:strand:- start:10910 stop:11140 length:231 start_codon:yes stop_codon:yes gene_type:complete